MAFTLRQLQYFAAIAEEGSITRASQNLSISQSAVTEAIKELEADLGIPLLERHRRGFNVTQKGHQFLRHTNTILSAVSGARQSFQEEQDAAGELNIGVTPVVAAYVLPDILARYRRAFPRIEINTIEESADYLEHLLIGGELDVAIMVTSTLRERMALQAEIIDVSPYRLWLPSGHPLSRAETIDIECVADEPLIMLMIDEIEKATESLFVALGNRMKVRFRTSSVEAVRSLVATGSGVAVLPELLYRPWSLDGDRIIAREFTAQWPAVQAGMVWRRGSGLSQANRDFVTVARSHRQSRRY
jgi:molybdate transport repressor ModE-like protein